MAWWHAYQAEPWGDLRADLRLAGELATGVGVYGATPLWPYLKSDAEIIAEFEELAAEQRAAAERLA